MGVTRVRNLPVLINGEKKSNMESHLGFKHTSAYISIRQHTFKARLHAAFDDSWVRGRDIVM